MRDYIRQIFLKLAQRFRVICFGFPRSLVPFFLIMQFFCPLTSSIVFGQEGSDQPVLLIEVGNHTNKLTSLSVDSTETYVVTASDDKTARIWELATGKLINILRPPIGVGEEGKLYTATFSPDGRTIAVGGRTGSGLVSGCSIYLFDRDTGRMIHRISGLPNVIGNLEYSPDGHYLGAVLGGPNGLRVFETDSYQLIGSDDNYFDSGLRLDFDSTSTHIITSSVDGNVRLYKIEGKRVEITQKRSVSLGRYPVGVKFSPDNQELAVGSRGSRSVVVLSTTDLSELKKVDAPEAKDEDLSLVAWSYDGRTLYAGGLYGKKSQENLVCSWTDNLRTYKETLVTTRLIQDIRPLHNGGIVFGQAEPGWGILDSSGNRIKYIGSTITSYFSNPDALAVNADTSEFRYSESGITASMSFSLYSREVPNGKNGNPSLLSPHRESKQLSGLDCCHGSNFLPTLNGKPLAVDEFDWSRSSAILPDNKTFLLGSVWSLLHYDAAGQLLWRVPGPSVAMSINTSQNGKLAIVAFADGTVRWYRVSDGNELLSFFVAGDDNGKWVLWTPSGYYDASSSGEDLIGWHVSNGPDKAADFFPIYQFKAQFYRPDIINQILQTADESLAVSIANEKAKRTDIPRNVVDILPPVIEINSPKVKDVSDTSLKLNYTLRNHSGQAVTGIKVLIDGREVTSPIITSNGATKGTTNITLQIPKRDSELSIIAENRFTRSLPAKIQIKWRGKG